MKDEWTQLQKEGCEYSLSFFVRMYIKVLEPNTKFLYNWHIDVLCDHLEKVARGEISNLDINIPPRTSKSLIVNILFPCWVWTWWPNAKFLSASHSASLSTRFNTKRRRLVQSPEYQAHWPIQFKKDTDTKGYFENVDDGFMASFSTGSNVTGEGGNFLLSDDLISAKKAYSEAAREEAKVWYFEEYFNRLQDQKDARRININQRLHEDDISGNIEKDHKYFERLIIQMVKEGPQIENITGWVDPREEGEFLHPDRYGPDEEEASKKSLGPYGWAGQMQQNPFVKGGGVFKESWIRCEAIDHISLDNTLISIDATFKDSKKSDYVVMQYWAKHGPDFYLVDMIRGKWDFPETLKRAEQFYANHKPRKLLIEDKANGTAIISILKKKISGIKAINPTDSKEARAQAIAYFWECKNVVINKDLELKDEFIAELVGFPKAKHDDMVDSMSQALEELRDGNSSDLLFA